MNEKKLSIIVPIYGVERYLPKCIDSLRNQKYQNVEIILVDDGSKDNCPGICDKYAAIDDRIIVIHKTNGGQGSARNCGLEVATGEYIAFVDADDYVSPTMYVRLIDAIENKKADIAVCGSFFEYKIYKQIVGALSCPKSLSRIEALRDFYAKDYIGCAPWNKVYKKSIWDNIRFPENHYREDEWIFYRVLDAASVIYHIGTPEYHYILRKSSSDRKAFSSRNLEAIDSIDEQYQFIKENYGDLIELLDDKVIQRRITILNEIAKSNNYKSNLHYVSEIVDYFRSHTPHSTSLKSKVNYILRDPYKYVAKKHYQSFITLNIKKLFLYK